MSWVNAVAAVAVVLAIGVSDPTGATRPDIVAEVTS